MPIKKSISVQMIIRYGAVGLLGTVTYAASVTILVELFHIDAVLCSIAGFTLSLLFSYILNYNWTFESEQKHEIALPKYIFSSLLGLGLSTLIMFMIVNVFEFWYFYGVVVATIVVPLSNFILFYTWAFATESA